ncbi:MULTISPECIES: chemotaxis protein CheA [unclassified Aureimonas]|uniref:chemotaxis protein CheA n=1 Tax=unclassified Aureimonas TaxID=2615206 RepID=UPI0006F641FA|nr:MULTISPECIES: chemotaxis protein CheA [unclassified Aureimonas]KQT53912.1 chemotaxis protein CheA [Aureimonas sp. Leaf427]KQT71648.1 chemotaxis protein CheA [Aureimonas sp. Leaf460]
MDAMAEIRATFFEECVEQLAELESGLLAMESGAADSDTVNAVFRAVHSVKGGAGAFNLNDLVHFAHIFETTLDEVRSDRMEPTPEVLRVLLRAADVLADLITVARDGGSVDAVRTRTLVGELKELVEGKPLSAVEVVAEAEPEAEEAEDEPLFPMSEGDGMDGLDFVPVAVEFDDVLADSSSKFRITFKPRPEMYAKANETARLIREVLALGFGRVTCDTSDTPLLPDCDPEGAFLAWTIDLTTDRDEAELQEIFEFASYEAEVIIERVFATDEENDGIDPEIAALLARMQAADDAAAEPAKVEEKPAAKAKAAPAPAAAPVAAAEPKPAPAKAAPAKAAPAPAAAAPAAANGEATTQAGATIRVDLERVDRLIDLVGELVIHQVMLSQRVTQAGLAHASDVAVGLDELEQLTREIQDSVMAIRAQPVKSVFQRLPRLVREVADATKKSVKLVTEGEGTEVDKTVIERLSDPLTHMIRNAIDHGVESPEKRLAAGKPEEGTVRVAAMHRSGRIVIEISDDGAGINRPVVREIAIKKGLIPPDAALTDEETDNLIFLPGFSTKTEVSELSGRGVGMDVVKRSIQALGGRVSIASKPGEGSMFTMSLPLTLAVLDGMIVSAGSQTLVVPLTAIIETLKPKPSEVRGFGSDQRLIAVRDAFLPLIDVAQQLGYRHQPTDAIQGVAILVEAENGSRSALLVDGIQGQRQVVIKSLESNYGRVPGVAAATIMGDGRVALILDVDAVAATSRFEQNFFGNGLQAAE